MLEIIETLQEPNITPQQKISTLLEQFVLSLDVKQKSRETYQKALKQFLRHISHASSTTLNRETIMKYKNHLIERGLSAYTISSYIVAVRKFFEFLESEKFFPNIAKGIKGMKQPKGFRKDPLTIEQVKDFLRNIDRSTLDGLRDYAIINLLVRTGLRTVEIARANIEDIRQQGGESLLYIQGKGRDTKDEFVLLTHDTLSPMRAYLAGRKTKDETEPLFISLSDRNLGKRLTTRSISRIVKTRMRNAGIDDKRLTAHSLRHTAVTLSLLGGATIQEAQSMARHANINTTLIYAHNIDRINKAPEKRIDVLLASM